MGWNLFGGSPEGGSPEQQKDTTQTVQPEAGAANPTITTPETTVTPTPVVTASEVAASSIDSSVTAGVNSEPAGIQDHIPGGLGTPVTGGENPEPKSATETMEFNATPSISAPSMEEKPASVSDHIPGGLSMDSSASSTEANSSLTPSIGSPVMEEHASVDDNVPSAESSSGMGSLGTLGLGKKTETDMGGLNLTSKEESNSGGNEIELKVTREEAETLESVLNKILALNKGDLAEEPKPMGGSANNLGLGNMMPSMGGEPKAEASAPTLVGAGVGLGSSETPGSSTPSGDSNPSPSTTV